MITPNDFVCCASELNCYNYYHYDSCISSNFLISTSGTQHSVFCSVHHGTLSYISQVYKCYSHNLLSLYVLLDPLTQSNPPAALLSLLKLPCSFPISTSNITLTLPSDLQHLQYITQRHDIPVSRWTISLFLHTPWISVSFTRVPPQSATRLGPTTIALGHRQYVSSRFPVVTSFSAGVPWRPIHWLSPPRLSDTPATF